MIFFIGETGIAILTIAFIALIFMAIIGIGVGLAGIIPIVCKILGYAVPFGILLLSIVYGLDLRKEKKKSIAGIVINSFINTIFAAIVLLILEFPIVALVMEFSELSFTDFFLTIIGIILFFPLLYSIMPLVLYISLGPYILVCTMWTKKNILNVGRVLFFLFSSILSFVLLSLEWDILLYGINLKGDLSYLDLQVIDNTFFGCLPPGIRQIVNAILMNGGELMRQYIINVI